MDVILCALRAGESGGSENNSGDVFDLVDVCCNLCPLDYDVLGKADWRCAAQIYFLFVLIHF